MQVWLQLGEVFARVSVGAILNSLWEALALALLAWVALRAVPRANASLRYWLWCLALVAVLILPVLALHVGSMPPAATASSTDPAVAVPQRFAQILFGLWYVVATILVLRLIISYVRLQQLKANARPLPPLYQYRVRRWLEASGGRRPCRLCVSDKVPMPVAIGLADPVIVLPVRLLDQLSDDELDQVGLHELAHLQRWDDYTNVFQKIAEALLFFNPAVYLIGRQLTLEREIACDDRVIAATGKPLTYAACLTRLVEATALTRQALPALGALSTRRQFAIRIERLLDPKRKALPFASGLAAVAVCATMLAALAIASHLNPLVAVAPEHASAQPLQAAVAPGGRAPHVIAEVFVLSRHPAARAAGTAAVLPATIVRRISTAVHRVESVARSNAVGARNFIYKYGTYQITGGPSNAPQASAAPASQPIAFVGPVPAALGKQLNVRVKRLNGQVEKLIIFVDRQASHASHARVHGNVPTTPQHDASRSYAADSAAYAADSASYAADSAPYAQVSREYAATSREYAKQTQSNSTATAPIDASASVSETDNVPALAVKVRTLSAQSRVDAVVFLAEHPDDATAVAALTDTMLHDPTLTVALRAVAALADSVQRPEQQAALIQGLRASDSVRVKIAIIRALDDALPDANAARGLEYAFSGAQPEAVQLAAVTALTDAACDPNAQAALVVAFNNATTARVKTSIIKALMDNVREPVVRRALQAALRSDQPTSVQLAAVEALAPAIDDPEIRAMLEQAGGSGSDIVRLSIKRALAQYAGP